MKNHIMKFAAITRATFVSAMLAFFGSFLTAIPGNAQEIVKASIKSEVLGQERVFGIHLPKNYDPKAKKKYPVIYALDGFKQIMAKFDALSEGGLVPETIVVGIPNMGEENRQRDLLPPYMKSNLEIEDSPMGRADKFLKFIETELMPYMKKNYKVSGVNAISGHSRGGVFVIYSLLANPGLFQARFAYSPAVWREDNLIVAKTREFLSLPNKKKSFFYMTMGGAETDKMKGAFNALTETLTKNPPKKIVWYSEYTKDANHQTNVELSLSKALEKWAEYLK